MILNRNWKRSKRSWRRSWTNEMKAKVNINRWRDTGHQNKVTVSCWLCLFCFCFCFCFERNFSFKRKRNPICQPLIKTISPHFPNTIARTCVFVYVFVPNNNCQWWAKKTRTKLCKLCAFCVDLYIDCLRKCECEPIVCLCASYLFNFDFLFFYLLFSFFVRIKMEIRAFQWVWWSLVKYTNNKLNAFVFYLQLYENW